MRQQELTSTKLDGDNSALELPLSGEVHYLRRNETLSHVALAHKEFWQPGEKLHQAVQRLAEYNDISKNDFRHLKPGTSINIPPSDNVIGQNGPPQNSLNTLAGNKISLETLFLPPSPVEIKERYDAGVFHIRNGNGSIPLPLGALPSEHVNHPVIRHGIKLGPGEQMVDHTSPGAAITPGLARDNIEFAVSKVGKKYGTNPARDQWDCVSLPYYVHKDAGINYKMPNGSMYHDIVDRYMDKQATFSRGRDKGSLNLLSGDAARVSIGDTIVVGHDYNNKAGLSGMHGLLAVGIISNNKGEVVDYAVLNPSSVHGKVELTRLSDYLQSVRNLKQYQKAYAVSLRNDVVARSKQTSSDHV
ncbi:MAG: hypothetical protein PHC51_14065 [bacterium]|nr:hypothetical protein [bacterium]